MVEEIMSAYHVTYERDESGWWVASVREVRGCHTQGRTVDEARRRIRKALELFVDDVRSAKLVRSETSRVGGWLRSAKCAVATRRDGLWTKRGAAFGKLWNCLLTMCGRRSSSDLRRVGLVGGFGPRSARLPHAGTDCGRSAAPHSESSGIVC